MDEDLKAAAENLAVTSNAALQGVLIGINYAALKATEKYGPLDGEATPEPLRTFLADAEQAAGSYIEHILKFTR